LTHWPKKAIFGDVLEFSWRPAVQYDEAKIEEVVLALLGVFEFEFEKGRVWKRFDFDVMDALHAKGYITEPRGRQESTHLTEEGMVASKLLAERLFGKSQ
jgi:hypothetical protein